MPRGQVFDRLLDDPRLGREGPMGREVREVGPGGEAVRAPLPAPLAVDLVADDGDDATEGLKLFGIVEEVGFEFLPETTLVQVEQGVVGDGTGVAVAVRVVDLAFVAVATPPARAFGVVTSTGTMISPAIVLGDIVVEGVGSPPPAQRIHPGHGDEGSALCMQVIIIGTQQLDFLGNCQ